MLSTLRDHVCMFRSGALTDTVYHETRCVSSLTIPSENIEVVTVLCDASPLGLETAHLHNFPGVLVANFDWCGIYETFLRRINEGAEDEDKEDGSFWAQCRAVVNIMEGVYHRATAMMRPRVAVPSKVGYTDRTRVVEVLWIFLEVTRRREYTDGVRFVIGCNRRCSGWTAAGALSAAERTRRTRRTPGR